MFNTQGSKRPVETFLVVKGSTALYNTAGHGNNITDETGAVVPIGTTVLGNGVLGVFDDSGYGSNAINTAITSGNTFTHSPSIYLAAGLPKDSTTNLGIEYGYPLTPRPFERSGKINGKNRILVTRQNYVAPQFCTWIIGSPTAAAAGQVNVLDNTEYTLQVAERSRINQQLYSNAASLVEPFSYVTPNYTSLATAEPTDHLLENLVYNIDRNSRLLNIQNAAFNKGNGNVVAFGIATTDPSGNGYNILTGSAGDIVTVVANQSVGGTFVMTADILASLQSAINNDPYWTVPAAVYINPIDLSIAGTTANVEAILFMGTDRVLAFKDRIAALKTKIKVGMTRGFDFTSVYSVNSTTPLEGQGTPRALELQYRATHGQRLYNMIQTEDPITEYPIPFVSTDKYTTFVIEHEDVASISIGSMSNSPLKTIVCVPKDESTFLSAFTTLMNTWLTSTVNVQIESI